MLIAEILTETEIKDFIQLAKSLKLDVLLEFHSENELMKVVDQESGEEISKPENEVKKED